jgi:endonuclease YncB( thermonuclease family)
MLNSIKNQIVCIYIVFVACSPAFAQNNLIAAKVLYVIDGDTFRANVKDRQGLVFETSVRVAHIDTPETKYGYECEAERQAGYAATRFAKSILKKRQTVFLSQVRPGKYAGRIIADVSLSNGQDYGQIMLQSGYAIPYEGGRKRKIWCN